ncbi:hypothetical protein [Mangrovivirga cuniculi]|uniref:Uncharacterized protein n=1 Tax=Mangrovivirga cuniculi TaxID=2715131 RepID=A0A4D7JD90_9BACT|nr:hypothetical protein [Mangrovivirga cuniculi]QCK14279.1 hypothetical protein DCC35_05730 [Mangrovivirga cuniculi]
MNETSIKALFLKIINAFIRSKVILEPVNRNFTLIGVMTNKLHPKYVIPEVACLPRGRRNGYPESLSLIVSVSPQFQ